VPTLSLPPICLVLTPVGTRSGLTGAATIDFDRLFDFGIRPGAEQAGLLPLRENTDALTGPLSRPVVQRLLLADFLVADLSSASPNLFNVLGLRHALRPGATIHLVAAGHDLPLDGSLARCVSYTPDDAGIRRLAGELAARLGGPRDETVADPDDVALVRLLQSGAPPEIARLKTDVFRECVPASTDLRRQLAEARRGEDVATLHRIEEALKPLGDVGAGVLVDLMLSYRALSDWDAVVALCDAMPPVLTRTVMVREQLAFALNRRGDRVRASAILEGLLAEHGATSETCGILGRVHKDRWKDARDDGDEANAATHLDRAIAAYLRGFEADWRDAYPGINALTLLDIKGDPPSLARRDALLPIVTYAVERRIAGQAADYWDRATLLELAVLGRDEASARRHLRDALAVVREPWEPESTADNLRLVRMARAERNAAEPWLDEVIAELAARRS
jgi:hypothetical protein